MRPKRSSTVRFTAEARSPTLIGGELSPWLRSARSPEGMSNSLINILLLGSGGREDALAWGLRQSPSCGELLAAPGNPGIARWAECLAIDPADPDKVVTLARQRNVGLVVVGP